MRRHRNARRILATMIALSTTTGALADALDPGARVADCASALRIGADRCAAGNPPQSADDAMTTATLEARVNEFLAAFGKPPREAARALVEPTDENITAMLRKEDERLAIAAYVGQRMTELRGRRAAWTAPLTPDSAAVPAMVQMQATIVANVGDPEGIAAAHRLDELAAAYPALDARLTWVGEIAPGAAAIAAASAAIVLPVSVAPPGASDADEPFVLLHDLRHHLERRLPARGASAASLRQAIVALRAASEDRR